MAHLADAPPDVWLWLQHADLTEPPEVVALRDDLLTAAFGRGHGTANGPAPNTYAFAIGDDIETPDVEDWFLARPQRDRDGVVRYWVESGSGPDVTRGSRTYDAGEVRDAFDEFMDWL